MIYVTDAHPFIWYLSEIRELEKTQRRFLIWLKGAML